MPLRSSVLTTEAELEAIRAPWSELWARSATNGPMLSPAWLLAWYRVFGPLGRRRLVVVAVRDAHRLVGLAPFVARTHVYRPGVPFRRLELLGTGEPEADEVVSEHLGLLADRGLEAEVARAFVDELAAGACGAWDEILVGPMDADAPTAEALANELRRTGARAELAPSGPSYHIDLPPTFAAYRSQLPAASRYLLTRSQRDFDEWAGADAALRVVTTPDELALGKQALLALHAERWGARGAFRSARFSSFHDQVMAALLPRGELELYWLTVRGEPIAAAYHLVANGRVHYYQSGRRLDVPARIRPGIVLVARAIERAIEAGRTEYDLFGGEYRYKRELATGRRDTVRLRAVRRPDGALERARMLAEEGIAAARSVRTALARAAPERVVPPAPCSARARDEDAPVAVLHGNLNMLRCFAGTGVETVVLSSNPDAPSFFSRHCGQRRLVASPVSEPGRAASNLLALGKLWPRRPVLYYGDDAMLLLVSRSRAALEACFRLRLPDADLVEALVDKVRFADLARRLRLPVPRTVTSAEARTAREILAAIPPPVIVKPFCHLGWRTSRAVLELGVGPVKALHAANEDELTRMLARVESFSPEFVVQEHIPGSEQEVYSFHAYLDGARRALGHFCGRKIRTYPSRAGVSTYVELVDEPDLARVGKGVLERLGLRGVVKLDFKRHPDTGRFHLLEVNPRYSLWNHLGAASGVNLPLLAYRDLAGLPALPAPAARIGLRWLSLGDDTRTFVRHLSPAGELSLAGWVASLYGPKVFDVFSWDDVSPFVMSLATRRADAAPEAPR